MQNRLQAKISQEIKSRLFYSFFSKAIIYTTILSTNNYIVNYILKIFGIQLSINLNIFNLSYVGFFLVFLILDFFNTNLFNSQEHFPSYVNFLRDTIMNYKSLGLLINYSVLFVIYCLNIFFFFNFLNSNNSNNIWNNGNNSLIFPKWWEIGFYAICFIILNMTFTSERLYELGNVSRLSLIKRNFVNFYTSNLTYKKLLIPQIVILARYLKCILLSFLANFNYYIFGIEISGGNNNYSNTDNFNFTVYNSSSEENVSNNINFSM